MTEWHLIENGIVPDGTPISVGGLNPWRHDWKCVDEAALIVAHPQYPKQRHTQRHTTWIYEMSDGEITVRSAAGGFSNTAWDFYLPHV